jgi:hypothetical protein
MKTYKELRRAEQSVTEVQGRQPPPPLAAAITIALAALATLMLIASSCSVARL